MSDLTVNEFIDVVHRSELIERDRLIDALSECKSGGAFPDTAEQIADVTKHKDIRVLVRYYMASNRGEVQARANELTGDIHLKMFGT